MSKNDMPQTIDEMQAAADAAIAAAGVPTEQELRTAGVPTPRSEEELVAYVHGLVERPHDYGTCVYAMSMAATAAFNYVAGQLGVTGFQASCADLDIIRRIRRWERFRVVNYDDLLYPQHWSHEVRALFMAELDKHPDQWVAEAKKLLADHGSAHERVRRHWEWLVEYGTAMVERKTRAEAEVLPSETPGEQ